MNNKIVIMAVSAFAILIAALVVTQWPKPASDAITARADIEEIVSQYLMDNPEVLIAALNAYQEREAASRQARIDAGIKQFVSTIADNPDIPILGNPDGNITIVEFFDYRCSYCKQVFPTLMQVVADDSDIRLVMAEFPILGEDSVYAARAALAVWFEWPEKYGAYHDILMASRGKIDETIVFGAALELDIEPSALQAAMKSDTIEQAISANHAMARELGISGTPAFIIGDTLVPGAIELADFQELIAAYREG